MLGPSVATLALRVILGVVLLPHGAQKLFGWFGGYGPAATIRYFGSLGIPAPLGWLAIATEIAGSLALVVGFQTRLAALAVIGLMTVAALRVHLSNGFFMNWFANQKGEGFEYHLLAIAIGLALVAMGGGRWSLDALLSARM